MGNTIKFLRIAISAFMLIICTHPAFSLSVETVACMCDPTCTKGEYCNARSTPCSCEVCNTNHYCPGGQNEYECPANYPKAASGNGDIKNCYLLTLQPGQMLQNKKAVNCSAGGFCPYTITISYTTDNSNLANTWGRASCESGVTGEIEFQGQGDRQVGSAAGSDAASDCYAICENQTITNGYQEPDDEKIYATSTNGQVYVYNPCTYTDTEKIHCNTGYTKLLRQCVAKNYIIMFNANGGSGTMANQTFTYGTTVTLNPNTFSLTGHTFTGWNTKSDGNGTAYADKASVSLTTGITLYAQWAPDEYTITWDLDGGKPNDWNQCEQSLQDKPGFTITKTSGLMPWMSTYSVTITATYGKYLPTIPEECWLYKAGHTFNGIVKPAESWGQGTVYYDKDYVGTKQWTLEEDTTLKAFWEPNVIPVTLDPGNYPTFVQAVSPNKIELKYGTGWYKEGGSSAPVPTRITNITTIPIVSGKVFDGFYYKDTQNNKIKMIDNTGEFTGSMTVTSFESDEYTYTFNAQYTDCECSGSTGTGVSSATATGTTTGNRCICDVNCKDGYSKDGVYTTITKFDYTGTAGDASVAVTCKPRKYKVTYDVTGGDNGPNDKIVVFGEPLPDVASPTRYGYTFTGFYDDTGKQYYTGGGKPMTGLVWDKDSDTTLYARWDANMYRVELNNQGATSSGTTAFFYKYDTADGKCKFYLDDRLDQCVTANDTLISTPSKTGYTFQGYYEGENGSGTQYINSNGVIDIKLLMVVPDTGTGQLTLYAKWALNTYTITYNLDGGTNASSNPSNYTVITETITLGNPTKTGYTFGGWYSTNGMNGTPVTTIDKGSTGNKTFWAKWTANKYTVTLNNDGADSATPGTTSVIATYDSDMPDITVPQKTGNTFQGYYTEINGQGTPYYKADGKSANTWDITENTILYASWSVNKYEVSFDGNCEGVDGTMADQTDRKYGDEKALPPNEFTCGHLIFIGWNTKADGTGKPFADKSTDNITTVTGTVTLYAQWIQCRKGCYCSGQIIKENLDANTEICTEKCPTNFTSDVGASAITDCYLAPGTTFTDSYGAQIKVPSDAKYYYRNKTPNQ